MADNNEAKAASGAKGGNATLKKYGPDHFRELAAKRRVFAGGRPPKPSRSHRPAPRKRKARKVNA